MSYVPIVVSTPVPPSPKVRELSYRISELVREYERDNPGITAAEVNQALQLARHARGGTPAAAAAVGVGLLAALAGGLVALYMASGGTVPPVALMAGIAAIIVVVLAVVLMRR